MSKVMSDEDIITALELFEKPTYLVRRDGYLGLIIPKLTAEMLKRLSDNLLETKHTFIKVEHLV